MSNTQECSGEKEVTESEVLPPALEVRGVTVLGRGDRSGGSGEWTYHRYRRSPRGG